MNEADNYPLRAAIILILDKNAADLQNGSNKRALVEIIHLVASRVGVEVKYTAQRVVMVQWKATYRKVVGAPAFTTKKAARMWLKIHRPYDYLSIEAVFLEVVDVA